MSIMDDLFAQIDDAAQQLAQSGKKPKKEAKTKTEFKNADNVFLGSVPGSYELRVLTDSDGKLFDEVYLHTIKTNNDKVTVVCSGDNCPICKLQKQLDDAGHKASWKFRKYKLNKLLVKVGDFNDPEVVGINKNAVYIAYVDDNFLRPLLDSIKNGRKYFEADLAKMLKEPESESGGFLVGSTRGKKTTFQFNFVQQLGIKPVSFKEVFGTDTVKLVNQGMFRTSYISEEKVKKASAILTTLLMSHVQNKGISEAQEELVSTSEPEVVASQSVVSEVGSLPTSEPVATPVTESPVAVVRDYKQLGGNGKPLCFGDFDPSSSVCQECPDHKRDCLMDAMANGKL